MSYHAHVDEEDEAGLVGASRSRRGSSSSAEQQAERARLADQLRAEEAHALESSESEEARRSEDLFGQSLAAAQRDRGASHLSQSLSGDDDPYGGSSFDEYRGRQRSQPGYVPPRPRTGSDASNRNERKEEGYGAGLELGSVQLQAQPLQALSNASNPFGADDESESDTFAPEPRVPAGTTNPFASGDADADEAAPVPSSYAVYKFDRPSAARSAAAARLTAAGATAASSSANGTHSAAGHAVAAPVGAQSASSGGVSHRNVSATDLERAQIETTEVDEEHKLAAAPLPMLLQYADASSQIRKDFATVDWFFSKSQMHRVRRLTRAANKNLGWQGKLKNWALAAQGWVLLFCVGVLSALTAYVIHHVSSWLSDLKGGYCHGHNLFSTRRVCCMDEQTPGETCQAWVSWSYGVASAGSAAATFWNLLLYVSIGTLFAAGGSWVCVVFAKQAAGSGIAELKIVLGGFVIKKFLGIRTLFLKSMGLTLAVASGMSLGKEGPMVHIACAWGHILSRPFLKYRINQVKKAEVLSAGVAAGVCVAFGSPLGGVLFALEVVCSYFPPQTMWRSFWCAICSALVLQWLDPFQTGKLVQFAVSGLTWQWFELVPFALLGIAGGLMGGLFNKLNVYFTKLRKRTPWIRGNPVGEVTVIAAVTALVSFPIIFSKGGSGALLAQLFSNCADQAIEDENDRNAGSSSVMLALCERPDDAGKHIMLLLVACAIKFFLTTVTYGSAIPSGVFMPSLCAGALMGRALGWLMWLWHRHVGDVGLFEVCAGKSLCVQPAIYAVIGAASVLGGITRMTVSLAVIMFEATGGLETVVPIMVAVVCAKWFGDAVGKQGLYGCLIELNGLPHIDTHVDVDLINPAIEMMSNTSPVCMLTYGETIATIQATLSQHNYKGFPIIDNEKDRLVTGYVSRAELELKLEKLPEEDKERGDRVSVHFSSEPPPFPSPSFLDLSSIVDRHPLIVRPSMPADRILAMFQALGLRYVLSCSPRGRIVGIIKKKDVLAFLAGHNIGTRK